LEEDAKAIDKALDAINKIVRSSIRSRVVTSWAIESQQHGTLRIASLFDV
jgi:hypothetical protein